MTYSLSSYNHLTTASSDPKSVARLRVAFLGMQGRFSLLVLQALLDAEYDVCAVMISAEQGAPVVPLPPPPQSAIIRMAGNPHTVVELAGERAIPAFAIRRLRSHEVAKLFNELQPDLACVAGFSQRIPSTLLTLPRHGFVNVHPSLLPAHRGPSPLFWVLREGRQHAGVTIHAMDERLDTGPIIFQEPIELPIGITGPEADRLCATLGGRLLVAALEEIVEGRLQPRVQPSGGSYAPAPEPADFRLDPAWSAEHAFAFMRGTAEWDRPYPITCGETTLWLTHALRYDAATCLHAPFRFEGDAVAIQFAPGTLWARARARHS